MDYPELGLNNNMTANSSPLATPPRMTGFGFDTNFDVQTKSVRVSNLVQRTAVASATGSFNTGESVTVDTAFSDGPVTNSVQNPTFGLPYLAIYTGTAAIPANQIYPSFGTAIANNIYSIHSGYDYSTWNGTNSTFAVNIENNSGTTTSVFALTQWKIISFTPYKESLT